MKNVMFGITLLALMLHFPMAGAKASEPAPVNDSHPISGLIGDWHQFRAGILDKTRQYNQDATINSNTQSRLPEKLIGKWQNQIRQPDGYSLKTILNLNKDHRFNYQYLIRTGTDQENWTFSGRWELRNQILMLQIDKSSYPGRAPHQILFWRLLKLGHSRLVYVRSGSDKMSSLMRLTG